MRRAIVWAGVMALVTATVAAARLPVDAGSALGALSGGTSNEALAGNLRGFLLKSLPDPLFTDDSHWGRHKQGPLGNLKKDGQWYRVRAWAIRPNETMVVDLRDAVAPAEGVKQFTLFVSFDANAELERQHWAMGVRLFSGHTLARLRLRLRLRCESAVKLETKGLLPEAVFRLRVLESSLGYDNLVVEHTAGVGGEAAKILGDAFVGGIRQWKPSLERRLLAKANEAIVKAADTKEVRLSVMGLLGGK